MDPIPMDAAEELDKALRELDQVDAVLRDLVKDGHHDLIRARQLLKETMKVINTSYSDIAATHESLELRDMLIVENKSSTLESLDDDCEILGVPLRLDEACTLDFDKHVEAIVGDEEARLEDSQKHRSLNIAQSNKQEYDRRYKEMPRDRIRFKR